MFNNNKIFFWLMLLIALGWWIFLSVKIIEGIKSDDWPSTQGVVLSSSIKKVEGKRDRYRLLIKYQYVVNTNKYLGENISIANKLLDFSEANKYLQLYRPNTNVPVYYDPVKSDHAYLVTGVDFGIYLLWLVSFGMGIFSIVNLTRLHKKLTKPHDNKRDQ
jgi:hypothetical protein